MPDNTGRRETEVAAMSQNDTHHLTLVLGREVHAARPAVQLVVVQAGPAHGGGVCRLNMLSSDKLPALPAVEASSGRQTRPKPDCMQLMEGRIEEKSRQAWHAHQQVPVLVCVAPSVLLDPARHMTSDSSNMCGSQQTRERTDYGGHVHEILQQHVVEHLLIPVLANRSRRGQALPVCCGASCSCMLGP